VEFGAVFVGFRIEVPELVTTTTALRSEQPCKLPIEGLEGLPFPILLFFAVVLWMPWLPAIGVKSLDVLVRVAD
jgi:hypothetical protein